MHYDADAYLKTLESPSITIRGHTYTGRLLSMQEFVPILERINQGKLNPTTDSYWSLAREYLTLIFPYRQWVARWRPHIVDQILALPNAEEVLAHFLELQVLAMHLPTSQTHQPEETNGTT